MKSFELQKYQNACEKKMKFHKHYIAILKHMCDKQKKKKEKNSINRSNTQANFQTMCDKQCNRKFKYHRYDNLPRKNSNTVHWTSDADIKIAQSSTTSTTSDTPKHQHPCEKQLNIEKFNHPNVLKNTKSSYSKMSVRYDTHLLCFSRSRVSGHDQNARYPHYHVYKPHSTVHTANTHT